MFKNIDLNKFTLLDQVKKMREEEFELIAAAFGFRYGIDNRDHVKEEACDVIQTVLGVAERVGIPASEIEGYYKTTHTEKIKSRPKK